MTRSGYGYPLQPILRMPNIRRAHWLPEGSPLIFDIRHRLIADMKDKHVCTAVEIRRRPSYRLERSVSSGLWAGLADNSGCKQWEGPGELGNESLRAKNPFEIKVLPPLRCGWGRSEPGAAAVCCTEPPVEHWSPPHEALALHPAIAAT